MTKELKDSKYGEETILVGFRVPKSKEKEFKTTVNRVLEEYQYEYLKNKLDKK